MIAFRYLLFLLVAVLGGSLAQGGSQPNVILILTDDQGYKDVGFNGSEDIPTPNIDRIAHEGVRFTNGYVSYPVCGPSRAGLLTGRYQGRFGFNHNPTVDPDEPRAGIPLEEKNIAEHLSPLGYRSSLLGKWHMGSHPIHHPMNRGFDEFYGFLTGGSHYLPEKITLDDFSQVTRKWQWYEMKLLDGFERVGIDDYLTDILSRKAVEFVEREAESEQPFFLFLSYNAPHTPLEATEKYLQRFEHIEDEDRRIYAAMISAMDDGVGMLLDAVRCSGIEQETLIFFLSDNGGATINASSNEPLRGYKGDMWEGGLRVPFAMKWNGVIPAGMTYHEPIISLDILATIAAYAGIPESLERPLDGVNLIPFLRGDAIGHPHERLYWRGGTGGSRYAVRAGDFKLVLNDESAEQPSLFDLPMDMDESHDLSARHARRSQRLQALWDTWNEQMKSADYPLLRTDNWWERR